MLDVKRIIENKEDVEANILKRGTPFNLEEIVNLEKERKKIILKTEEKKK